jgi:acyl-CoA synthetase (AMP-forming)/AMP-acid ligase II
MRSDPILDAFDLLAARDGSAALVATDRAWASRSDVDAWADAAAAALTECGAPPRAYVLLAAANGAGFLAALIGARRSGLVPVLMDWMAPLAERSRVGAALRVAATLSCDETFPRGAASFRVAPGHIPASAPEGVGFVKLTSGSSGLPCGVAFTPEALAADDDQLVAAMGLSASDRFLASIPWSHSYALSSLVMPALRRGCLLVVPETGDPLAPVESARALSATVYPTVPPYVHALGSLAAPPPWPPSLRTVISAGAPLAPESAARFRHAFGVEVHVFYGASECGGIAYDREGGGALRGTVGTPIAGVDVELDEGGVVVVRSPAVGARHVPEASDTLSGGVFRSADLAKWTPTGELALTGRADGVINVGAKKVHPSEVEAVLRAMPGVREALVLGVPAPSDERTILRAFVACDPAALSYADIAAWCRARLAGHKVPRSIVCLEAIPRNARGKIDRIALAAWKAAPEP